MGRVRRDDLDRRIVAMAVPALGSLAVEPAYVLVDTAIVGRLGTEQLAGLALAATVLLTALAGCNFLAYGTTQRSATHRGAGRPDLAAATGVQALWMVAFLGLPLAAVVAAAARPLTAALGGQGDALEAAVTYLRISALGLPAVLVALAGQGVLRGAADLRTPFRILLVSNLANVVIELVLVFGLDLGIAGSAWSTVVAQAGAAVAFLVVVRPHLRGAPTRRPDRTELGPLATAGRHLLLRVGAMLAAIVASTALAGRIDTATLAAHQIVLQMFNLLALVLDALAIPAQTLVGAAVGASALLEARRVGNAVTRLSLIAGGMLAAGLLVVAPALPALFTSDDDVASRTTGGLMVLAVVLLPGAVAFALDGVLIGAGDYRFLARASLAYLAAFAPPALVTLAVPQLGIVGVWSAILAWMMARAVANRHRFAGDQWHASHAVA